MSVKRQIFSFFVRSIINCLGLNGTGKISCAIHDCLEPVYRGTYKGEMYLISCPNSLVRWRAETYFAKEPETIEWIDTFNLDEVLFDIGANVGLYSIYAAKKGIRVVAFEPESQNFALLNKNVYINKCADRVSCFNVALSDKDCIDYLNIPVFQAGGAINCFGGTTDWNDVTFTPAFKQGSISFSLDSFLTRYPDRFPTHIKIDVDGIEPKIIKGAAGVLKDKRLKSLSVEINESLPEHVKMIEDIRQYGLSLIQKRHAPMFDDGEYSRCFNYIFARKS